jgi:hypothetical protein
VRGGGGRQALAGRVEVHCGGSQARGRAAAFVMEAGMRGARGANRSAGTAPHRLPQSLSQTRMLLHAQDCTRKTAARAPSRRLREPTGAGHQAGRASAGLARGALASEEQLSPLVREEADAVDKELAGLGVLAVHEVADQDEQDDEDVEQQRRLQEEVVAEDQKGLHAVPAAYGADEPCEDGIAGHGALRRP